MTPEELTNVAKSVIEEHEGKAVSMLLIPIVVFLLNWFMW
jgi:hypothetical protein